MSILRRRVAPLACIGLTFVSLAAAQQTAAPLSVAISESLGVSDWSLQRLDVPALPTHHVTVGVELDGQRVDLALTQHSLRAPDFQVLEVGANGIPIPVEVGPARTFRGPVAQWAGAEASGSILGGSLHGIVRGLGDAAWGIQPLTEVDPTADPAWHVVYRVEDVLPADGVCGVDDLVHPHAPTTGGGVTYGTGMDACEIGFDADFEFFILNGNSINSTVADIEMILNNVSSIYESDVQITYWITTIVVRSSSNDPYTSSNPDILLGQFNTEWNTNLSFLKRDTAHLMTGRNVDGSTIGYGGVGVVCNQGANFAFSQSRFSGNITNRTALTAHELGHNWGASHCDNAAGACRIMCSGLGGCAPDLTRFGPAAIAEILAFKTTTGCTPELGLPRTVPFLDTITGNIDVGNWPSRQGTASNNQGVNEPSGARSLNLSAASSDPLAGDWIRSNYFLLGAESGLSISYWTEHRGVEAGEELVLEYKNSAGNWIEIDRVTSDGVTQNNYVQQIVSLPAGAYHDLCQFQFRAEVSDTGDDWFVDDIEVGSGCATPTNYCVGAGNSFSVFGSFMTFSGSTSVAANDLTLIAIDAVPTQFGVFYYGPNQTQTAFGDGFRCVGGSTNRLPLVVIDAGGQATFALDLNSLSGGSAINAGDTQNFQFWFRDPAAGGSGYNLSDGLNTVWCP